MNICIASLTTNELAVIRERLGAPDIAPSSLREALDDVYIDFFDTGLEEVLNDVRAGYLTYHEDKPTDAEIDCEPSGLGYLWYYDGQIETLTPLKEN